MLRRLISPRQNAVAAGSTPAAAQDRAVATPVGIAAADDRQPVPAMSAAAPMPAANHDLTASARSDQALTADVDTGAVMFEAPLGAAERQRRGRWHFTTHAQLMLPVGTHNITLRSLGFYPYTVTVYVHAAEPVDPRHRFAR